MNPATAYARAVDALTSARRARRDALRYCEHYEPAEAADYHGYPGSAGQLACFWDGARARADWCEACAARTDLGDWPALKRARAAALGDVLRAGRADSKADTVTRTSIALVKARDEVKRLRAERFACVCEFERSDVYSLAPLRERGPEWRGRQTTTGREASEAPCWAVVESDDAPNTDFGRIPQFERIGESDGFCPPCKRRLDLHEQLRTAQRRVVALTSGHLNATRAHMRRTGELPPTLPRPACPPAGPTSTPQELDDVF